MARQPTCSGRNADPATEQAAGSGRGIKGDRGVASVGQHNGLSAGSCTGERGPCSASVLPDQLPSTHCDNPVPSVIDEQGETLKNIEKQSQQTCITHM